MVANGFQFNLRWSAPIIQECESVLQFGPTGRRGERYTDMLVCQTKPVTIAWHGWTIAWRIFGSGPKKRSPPQCRKRDDREFAAGGHREYVVLGATMRGVVADHQKIKKACLRPTGSEPALMACK